MGMAYKNTIIAMHNDYCVTIEVKNAMNDDSQI